MPDKPSASTTRIEDVVALFDGELDGARAAAVRAALRDDPELARAGLDVVDPSDLGRVANLDSAAVDQAWAKFQASLDPVIVDPVSPGARPAEPAIAPSTPAAVLPWRRRLAERPLWAMAAGLAVGLGLGLLLASRDAGPTSSGLAHVARLELAGTGGPLRGEEPRIVPAPDVATLVLLLVPPSSLYEELPPRVRYLLSRDGKRAGEGEAMQLELGSYSVSLVAAATPPGTYRIELVRENETASFASYDFVLAGPRL